MNKPISANIREPDWENRYFNAKQDFLSDPSICKENKLLYNKFFDYQEYKLKRVNNLRKLDNGTYKTLYGYIQKFRNINVWFGNKPLKQLTKEDIKRVYDDLEDGKIKNRFGKPYENLEDSYYSKVFKSKLFEMAGKIELAREVIAYHKKTDLEVSFITEDDFRKITRHAYKPHHKLLFWLAWDYGENINSLLRLQKKDFHKEVNDTTQEPEYRLNLRKEILKRSRKPRSEYNNYKETFELLEEHLADLTDEEYLFKFDYANAKKVLNRAVKRSKVKTIPKGNKPTWKDLRSGMACDLLKKGWNVDELNARLGHKPSSDEIDKYINFLAIDRHTPKKKVHQFQMSKLTEELEASKERERLQTMRIEAIQKQMLKFEKAMRLIELVKKIKK